MIFAIIMYPIPDGIQKALVVGRSLPITPTLSVLNVSG